MNADFANQVEPFTVPEQLRMARRHLRSLFSIVEMEKAGTDHPNACRKLEKLGRPWKNSILGWI